MKKLFTFVLAAMAFVACTQNDVEELTDNRVALPETLTGGFEGGDTRIELNEALKTVWTEGDEVSVFYRSYENMRWAFQGETGDRSGELKRVSGEAGEQTMDNVVVVYPYSENYVIDITDGYVEATLPAVQSYKDGSYGAEGNIMVAESDYRQFTLKSVVGWLRVELTGEGESVKSITLRGNAGEQLAGDILVNAADASCILASEGAAAEDNSEVAGNLMLEESILTEITLNCGSGVMLGSEAKSFYIALLPQTFEQGITIEVECGNGTSTTKSTAGKLVVERNHIVPMASFKYDGVLPEVYELAYTTNDGKPLDPYTTEGFGGEFMENIYDAATGRGVLKFAGAITTIPEQAFAICENLTWIDIPEGITTIGTSAFTGCTALEELTIPSTLTSLGSEAFQHCSFKATINCENVSFRGVGFTEVIIGDSVTTIGDSTFYGCSSLTSVTIPDGVTTIEDSAFENCDSLTSVIIGNSVTTIGDSAFYYCSSLTSVTIPDSVTTIGMGAFASCNSLTSVTIPDSVTTIGDSAFSECHSLTSVTIPDSVTLIGDWAFNGCDSLTSVTIPDSVTTIGGSAFRSCSSLTSVTIPDSVTTIGDDAFYRCGGLTSVYCKATTPPTLDGSSVFDSNASGRKIYVPEGSLRAYKMAEYWSVYADDIVGYDFETGEEGVVNSQIFYTATALVEPYDASAFNVAIVSNEWDEATGEGVITFDGELTTIGGKAFYWCTSLTNVTIPDSVTTIGEAAFYGCESLTSVTIPDSVTTIGRFAFHYCGLTSVTIPDSVMTIGEQVFASCYSLTSVTIPDSVTTIGIYAFTECNSLTSVTIPDSVTTIGSCAFFYCGSLTSVTIPDSVTTIGDGAFFYCYNLTNVYCKATTPPTLGSDIVFDQNASGRKIYVPEDSLREYKMAENWSEYADYIVGYNFETGEEIPETPETPSDFVPTHTATKWLWSGASNYGNKYVVSGDGFTIDVHFPTSVATESSLATGEYVWMVTSFFSNSDATNFTTRSFKLGGSDDTVPISDGSAKVTASGDTYTIQLTLVHRETGYKYMIEYVGKLNDAGEAVPDDVVMDVVSVLAKMRTDGKIWDLILIENDYTMGEPMTQITVEMGSANMKYITSGTYSTLNSNGILPGTVNTDYGEWSNSVYRYNTILQEAIEDCELTIAVDEATQTAAISGYLVSKQIDDETGRTFDVNVIFEFNGHVEGFRWEDPTDEITDWKTFSIFAEFDDCKCIKGVSNGGNEVAIYLHTLGATKADALAAGTYPVADWVYTTTSNYCETVSTKVNGSEITSGSVTVEGGDNNYTVRFELSDGSNTYKGVYTGALY